MVCATNDVSEAGVDDAWKDGVNLILEVGKVFRMETSALIHAVAIYHRVQTVETNYVTRAADCINIVVNHALPTRCQLYQLASFSCKS